MNARISVLTIIAIVVFSLFCNGQFYPNELTGISLKESGSVLFGQDIRISNVSNQNQGNVSICSASNGWLYAAYTFDSLDYTYYAIIRSIDNGYTWDRQSIHRPALPGMPTKKLEIIASGTNASNQKVFLAWVIHRDKYDFLSVFRYKGNPMVYDKEIFYAQTQSGHDIALAHDLNYPALFSNPGSIGFLYSVNGGMDSIIFRSSSDGGNTFKNRQVVAISYAQFHKVALAYGKSNSENTGRYFAAWEEKDDTIATLGHIYTAHSNPNFNSPFTTPVRLDGLDPSFDYLCRNPAIACQTNDMDNDSLNMSEIVLFEKFNPESEDFDIVGFYNKKAASSNDFTRLNIAVTPRNEIQPNIIFNQYDSSFMVTYFDSTAQKLPFLKKDLNLPSPDNWHVVTSGYNDDISLKTPRPKIALNHGLQKPCNVWVGNQSTGKGVALFDAVYIPSLGISDRSQFEMLTNLRVFPNPCSTILTITMDVKQEISVRAFITTLFGQDVVHISDITLRKGIHSITHDVSSLPAGMYMVKITFGEYSLSSKFCVIK